MDVINRYFRTLRIFLPKAQRDDIIRELSEEVGSQIAETEAALGRPLDAGEQAALIGQYGHPLVTAARYQPQRHLIGPVVFPYYWMVLRVALVLVAMGHLLGAAVLVAGGATAAQIGQLVETAHRHRLEGHCLDNGTGRRRRLLPRAWARAASGISPAAARSSCHRTRRRERTASASFSASSASATTNVRAV